MEEEQLRPGEPPISLLGLDHIVLRSGNVPVLLEFYQQVLGANVERTEDELGLTQLRAGSALIDIVDCAKPLGTQGGDLPARNAPNVDHFCLLVSPWQPEILGAWLQSHGVAQSAVGQRYGAEGFGPSLYIQDPDGNTIELKGKTELERGADEDELKDGT